MIGVDVPQERKQSRERSCAEVVFAKRIDGWRRGRCSCRSSMPRGTPGTILRSKRTEGVRGRVKPAERNRGQAALPGSNIDQGPHSTAKHAALFPALYWEASSRLCGKTVPRSSREGAVGAGERSGSRRCAAFYLHRRKSSRAYVTLSQTTKTRTDSKGEPTHPEPTLGDRRRRDHEAAHLHFERLANDQIVDKAWARGIGGNLAGGKAERQKTKGPLP